MGRALRWVQRPHVLARYCRKHEASLGRLRHFGGARDDPGTGHFKQQVPRRDDGRVTRQLAESSEHMLVAAGLALVRVEPKSDSVCRHHGIAALADPGHGRWPQADAKDLWS